MSDVGNVGNPGTSGLPNLEGVDDVVIDTPTVPAGTPTDEVITPQTTAIEGEVQEVPSTEPTTFNPPGTDDLVLEDEETVVDEVAEPNEVDTPDDLTTFYSGVSDIFKDSDIFSGEIGEIKSQEDLTAAMEAEVNSRLTERQRQISELAGEGVDISTMNRLNQGLGTLNKISTEQVNTQVELQRDLIVGDFIERGFSQEDSIKNYDMINKNGTAGEEAAKALEIRKGTFVSAIEKVKVDAKASRQADIDASQKQLTDLTAALQSKEVLGRKVGEATIAKLQGLVSTPVAQTSTGESINAIMKYRQDNPVDFEHKLSYLFLITDGFKNLKSFDRSAETRVSRTMRAAVNTLSTGGAVPGGNTGTSKNVIDMDTIDDIV